jgi:hypothetical protein
MPQRVAEKREKDADADALATRLFVQWHQYENCTQPTDMKVAEKVAERKREIEKR